LKHVLRRQLLKNGAVLEPELDSRIVLNEKEEKINKYINKKKSMDGVFEQL
jgi:hypothetical protein